jgi:hypothetical protein
MKTVSHGPGWYFIPRPPECEAGVPTAGQKALRRGPPNFVTERPFRKLQSISHIKYGDNELSVRWRQILLTKFGLILAESWFHYWPEIVLFL